MLSAGGKGYTAILIHTKTVCYTEAVKAKFHYAVWSETGSKMVADLQLMLDDRPNFCSLQVYDQLQTCLRPDSVMEFGFEPVCDQIRRFELSQHVEIA